VSALFRRGQIPVDVKWFSARHAAGEIGDLVAVPGDRHHLVLAELDSVAGVVDECRNIGGDEMLAVAYAEHQRRGPARGDDQVGLIGVRDDEGECALQPSAHQPYRLR
jgi:hypothetical protein